LFADQALDDDYICEWSDQQAVRDLLLFEDTPSPLKVWVTQEDVWAYRTMLEVIAKTNASVGADRPSNAAVRVIEALEVGQAAAEFSRTTGRITLAPEVTAVAAPAGTEEAATGARPDVGGGDFERGRAGEGGPTLEQERVLLLSKRYIDRQGKPIPFEGTSTNYQTAFGPEYKRLPVRTVLRMDWRKVNFLISECANQPLQVEVQEVRKNPLDGGAGSGSFYNTRRTSGDSMRGGPGTFRSGSIPTFPVNPHLSTVVIQGVIYIFNEPNQAVLQVTNVNAVGP
jgi:hypothetical protein